MSNKESSPESSPESLFKLCTVCERIEQDEDTDPKAVKQSALTGCSRCGLIVQAMEKMVPDWDEQLDRRLSSSISRYARGNQSFELYWSSDTERDTKSFELFTIPGDYCPWGDIKFRSILSGNTSSAASLVRVKNWLKECIDTHALCGNGSKTTLPRRVLDLGEASDNRLDAKLYESVSGESGRYICLSHCWGVSSNHVVTTTDNIQDFKNIVPWSILPLTFKDAIDFTRRLGIRFLWIDSLCIVQNDPQDWLKESAQMLSIYQNSYLTIAATKSPNSSSGCYTSSSREDQEHKIHSFDDNGASVELYVRKAFVHTPFQTPGRFEEFPLLQRAWVYQERLMSTRMLHFGPDELVWECREYSRCECTALDTQSSENPFGKAQPWLGMMLTSSHANLKRNWHATVFQYSQLDLTYEKDKLPALSGLAKRMRQQRRGIKYLAGLWEDTLLEDLLWTVSWSNGKRPHTWRAPYWSWASVDGNVLYRVSPNETLSHIYATIVEAICQPLDDNPNGAVVGRITIRGLLVKAIITHMEYDQRRYLDVFTLRFSGKGEPEDANTLLDTDVRPSELAQDDYVYFLRMAGREEEGKHRVDCLVLKMVDRTMAMYQRVGMHSWDADVVNALGIFENIDESVITLI